MEGVRQARVSIRVGVGVEVRRGLEGVPDGMCPHTRAQELGMEEGIPVPGPDPRDQTRLGRAGRRACNPEGLDLGGGAWPRPW